MLSIENLHFAYADKKILKGVTLHVSNEEIVSLIGVSGSGKTTLFRLITGLIPSHDQAIKIGEYFLPAGAQHVTYMHQEDLLLPWRTVFSNLMLLSELGQSISKDGLKEKALLLLNKLGLKGCGELYPHQLSGGMRQRVSLARALLQDRPLLLLDEPFGPLDVIIREELYQLLHLIRKEHKKTILLVTHDFRDAIALSDRILVLGEGKIIAQHCLQDTQRNDPCSIEKMTQTVRQQLISKA